MRLFDQHSQVLDPTVGEGKSVLEFHVAFVALYVFKLVPNEVDIVGMNTLEIWLEPWRHFLVKL